ncbi:trypsin-like serine peptidase [Staphylococcus delphini]|uniref:trypsin-like serine peptidase n=1 Tax=Staphylococcus delphini TaxID=53344 RepID=UPI001CCEEAB4|nr:trypsin-like serine protease [Staphylococcus delphini]MBZ8175549.1 trypsin-like serine protease [Staphylococcus delphini]
MKKLQLLLLMSLVYLIFMPIDSAYAAGEKVNQDTVSNPHQEIVPDTVRDPHSKYNAKFSFGPGKHCTAVLISSTAALTARHCVGNKRKTNVGTIYPGASGSSTPFGYMNISEYIPHPNLSQVPNYDIAILKGTERDQDKFYKYYIGKFKTTVRGYTSNQLQGFVGKEAYSYGYPYKSSIFYQYRSDGSITSYADTFKNFFTDIPSTVGQSGSGVFTKDGNFIAILIQSTSDHKAVLLPLTTEIADWINKNAN